MDNNLGEALEAATGNIGSALASAQGKREFRVGSQEIKTVNVGGTIKTEMVPPIHAIGETGLAICGEAVNHIFNELSWWDIGGVERHDACVSIAG